MELRSLPFARLCKQQLLHSHMKSPAEVVEGMVAMQAQDFPMAKWAIGIRGTGMTVQVVNAAINSGAILRTHVLRPTWHVVSSNDIHWLLQLTAPHIKAQMKSALKQRELTPEVIRKSYKLIEKALLRHRQLDRSALVAVLENGRIATQDHRASNLLMCAELDGIICSGAVHQNRQLYALLQERLPIKKAIPRDESLAMLAQRYIESRAPATLQDFAWWSGLPMKDARMALDLAGKKLVKEQVGEAVYYLPHDFALPVKTNSLHLLPAFDEYLIAYADRSSALQPQHQSAVITANGIFMPAVLFNGHVAAIWKRITKKQTTHLHVRPLQPFSKSMQPLLQKAIRQYGDFIQEKITLEVRKGASS